MSDRGSAASLEAFASRWVVAGFALAGLVIGLFIFSVREPVYEARTIVSVNNPLGTMGDEVALITSDRVLSPATASLGFAPDIEVEPNDVADLLSIIVRANDPDDAANAANLVAQFYEQSQTTTSVRVADPAEPNPTPVAPSRMAHVLLGSLLGAAVGFAVSAGRSLRAALPTRTRSEPAERPAPIRPAMAPSAGLSTLAEAPDDAPGPLSAHAADDVAAEVTANDVFVGSQAPTLDVRGDYAIVTPAGAPDAPLSSPSAQSGPPAQSNPPTSRSSDAVSSERSPMSNRAPTTTAAPFGGRTPVSERAPSSARVDLVVGQAVADDIRIIGTASGPTEPASPDDSRSNAFSSAASSMVARPPASSTAWRSADEVPDQSSETAHSQPPSRAEAPVDAVAAPMAIPEPEEAMVREPHSEIRARIDAERELEELRTSYEARINDLVLEHTETLGNVEADFERQQGDLKRELADARKAARIAAAQVKRLSGDDQHRIGDLQAQAEALEAEISTLRGQLESERIAHVREITNERDAADRALDNARREFRDQLDAADLLNRRSLADSRTELDDLLAAGRAEHQAALDRQHTEYDQALNRERDRHKADLARLAERHREEMTKARALAEQETTRQVRLTKQTISDLRAADKRQTTELEELRQAERQYRAELTNVRKQLRFAQQKHNETEQTLRDELAMAKKSLTGEKERNAALRDDVVRRTAEAHQAVDRAIEDRSTQLAELEALVAKHRNHAEERVREATASAEERVRESARREAELSARITRLERELDEMRRPTG